MKPQIILGDNEGHHNQNITETITRLGKDASYKDLSFVLIVPALESIATRVVSSWMNMFNPPNGRMVRLFAQGMEVGEAYSQCVEMVLNHPELSKFRFIVTLEHDNAPPADGLMRLLACKDAHPEFHAIGGLYFTKGYGGVAQIWGNPKEFPISFRPQLPDPNGGLVECCGTGMGFTCFDMKIFKDKKLRRPWFRTQTKDGVATQDLYAWNDWRQHGYRCAVDCSIKVGHWDQKEEIMW